MDIVDAGNKANKILEELDGTLAGLERAHCEIRNAILAAYNLGKQQYKVLLSEKQKLLNEIDLLHKDGMTIYGMMEDGRAKATATRCAEICEQKFGFSWLDCGKYLGEEIRKEFKL